MMHEEDRLAPPPHTFEDISHLLMSETDGGELQGMVEFLPNAGDLFGQVPGFQRGSMATEPEGLRIEGPCQQMPGGQKERL